ncbi:MAG: NADH-quinone oxidoreductase subunit L [Calditrichia bacterium]
MESYIWYIPLLPLFGAVFLGIFGFRLPKWLVTLVGNGTVGTSFVLSVFAFSEVLGGNTFNGNLFDWIVAGQFKATFGVLVDQLSVIMMLVVTGVGFLIHIYSIGYMAHDEGYPKFFTYLNLFIFSMLLLVMGNNLLLLYLGWEGVGLCSYLLIGFWYHKPSAAKAGMKAFITNRIGDVGFAIGIFLIFTTIGSIMYTDIFNNATELASAGIITVTLLMLFVGATGKSAQFPLYVWLPDAMEGPTPVSALIHAATMVTAGVYMVARFNVLFTMSKVAMTVVVIIGTFTALFAATMAITQNDIKKVLAYSTISQLGYMFIGVGVGAFAAGVFHLMTHAFFKALLFLGAGSVIHAMHEEQDIQKMGGLFPKIKITAITFIIAWLAISGLPPFAGFFSKDAILAKAFEFHWSVWIFGVIGAGITAFYMTRLIMLTFFGESRVDSKVAPKIHESPYVMTVPLMILAVLSVIGGWVGIPKVLHGGDHFASFLSPVFAQGSENLVKLFGEHHVSHALEYGLMAVSVLIALGGIGLGYSMYIKKSPNPVSLAEKYKGLYTLLYNKYYVDEIYQKFIINPFVELSRLIWKIVDVKIIDGFVNGLGKFVILLSHLVKRIQTGYLQIYAAFMLFGTIVVLYLIIM